MRRGGLSEREQADIWRRYGIGESLRSISRTVGRDMGLLRRLIASTGGRQNTNGLLRQYYPKGTSLAAVTQQQLDAIAEELNNRPRQTLGFRSPSELFDEAVALTT